MITCPGCNQEISVTRYDDEVVSECGGEGEGSCAECNFASDAKHKSRERAIEIWKADALGEHATPPTPEECFAILAAHKLARDKFRGWPSDPNPTYFKCSVCAWDAVVPCPKHTTVELPDPTKAGQALATAMIAVQVLVESIRRVSHAGRCMGCDGRKTVRPEDARESGGLESRRDRPPAHLSDELGECPVCRGSGRVTCTVEDCDRSDCP